MPQIIFFVTVGVLEASPRDPKYRIDNWASLRASRLTERMLVEQVDFGAEGGVYRSPFGQLALDESGRALGLSLNPGRLTADALVRYLLAMAQPGNVNFRADYAGLFRNADLIVQPGGGHTPWLDEPERFVQTLRGFLR